MLFRLRADAEVAAHPRRSEVLRRLRHPQGVDGAVALHVPHVPVGRVHSELSRRSGHHQPLQAAAGAEDEETRGAGDADVHHVDTDRRESVVIVFQDVGRVISSRKLACCRNRKFFTFGEE